MTENKYATITFAKADELNDYADYGFQSYNEKPTHKRNIKVSAKARDEIEKIRTELNETQSEFCGRILSEAVQSEYDEAVEDSVALASNLKAAVVAFVDHEESVARLKAEFEKAVGCFVGDKVAIDCKRQLQRFFNVRADRASYF